MQCDMNLINTFRRVRFLDFHKLFACDKFPELGDHARRMTSFFEGTNVYEQFFSK